MVRIDDNNYINKLRKIEVVEQIPILRELAGGVSQYKFAGELQSGAFSFLGMRSFDHPYERRR